jgi:hypothetical protein
MGYDDFDGFEDDDYQDERVNGPKALREALAAAKKALKERDARLEQLTSQVASRNLKDVLESKSLRPGLAKTIAAEGVDTTDPAAIEAWLSDGGNQEDFGFSLPAAGASPAEGELEEADGLEDLAAAQARMQDASLGALPDDRFQQARTEITGAKSLDEIQASLNRAIKNTN